MLVQCTSNVELAVAITMVTGFLPSMLSEAHVDIQLMRIGTMLTLGAHKL